MHVIKQSEDRANRVAWEGNHPYPEALLDAVNASPQVNHYPLLRGIGFYEDTYFNSQQVQSLISELVKFKEELAEKADRNAVESLIKFAETIRLQEHLVFIGD